MGSASFAAGGLVAAVVVELEVAHEAVVDEHGGVGLVDHDVGGPAGMVDTDVDFPGSDAQHAVGAHDGCRGALGGGERDAGVDRLGRR